MGFNHVNNKNKLKNMLYFGCGALSAGLSAVCVFHGKTIQKEANKVILRISDKFFKNLDVGNERNFIVIVVYNECDKHSDIKNELILSVLDRFDNIEKVSFLTCGEAKEYFHFDSTLEKSQYPVLLVYDKEGLFGKIEAIENISELIETLEKLIK